MADVFWNQRDAEGALARARGADADGASNELGVVTAGEPVAFVPAPAVFHDRHVAVGTSSVAFERPRMLAHCRLHELGARTRAAVGKSEFVAARTGSGGAEPTV